jgi:prepilin-type N-terminal cleavage/methylation domain-containing protein
MNKHHQRPPARFHSERRTARGFTLIEILVVLALTLVMMSMFATIFTMTGTFVTKQKGVGENDQSARILTTVLKTDLEARTMRLVVPFQPNSTVSLPIDALRQGYFYYSENDPLNDQDDVLQFTIDLSKLPSTNPQHGGQLFGLATNLPLPWQSGVAYPAGALVRPTAQFGGTGFIYKNLTGGTLTSGGTEPNWNNTAPPGPIVTGTSTVTDAAQNWTVVPSAPDQPDGDDGRISYTANPVNQTINPANPTNSSLPSTPDSTGASQLAEVCYFLRHGNLCRRVLLIRQPYDLGADTGSQPQDTGGAALILGVYPPVGYTTTNNFWTDFDYSARIQPVTGIAPATGVLLHGSAAPEASLINTNGATPNPFAIGRPDNRFGFDQSFQQIPPAVPPVTNGRPREYDSNGTFMGRYTHEETSNLNFLFPGNLPAGGSPMAQTTTATLDAATGSFITQFQGGPRRGEDILLTNVIAFDVKILDPLYTEPTAPLTDLNRNGIIDGYISAGPPIVTTPTPAFVDLGHLGTTGCFSKAAQNATMIGYGPNPPLPTTNNVFDTWHPAFDFNGDTINDPPPYTGLPSVSGVTTWNTTWTASTAYSVGQVVAPPAASGIVNGLQYYCVTGGTTGTAMPFLNSDAPTNNYAPLQVLGTPIADGTVQWVAQTPVLAIQITVKYLDPTQNLLRQVTIVQTFALP